MRVNRFLLIGALILCSFVSKAQWTDISLDSQEDFKRIKMVTDQAGYILSDLHFYRTENGGDSWEEIKITGDVQDFFFVNPSKGYMIATVSGETLLKKTNDAGMTWQNVGPCQSGILFFSSESNGYIVASDFTEYSTSDGGTTWNQVGKATKDSKENSVYSLSAYVGYIGNDKPSGFAKTTQERKSWESMMANGEDMRTYAAIDNIDADHCILVGKSGKLAITNSKGDIQSEEQVGQYDFMTVDCTERYCFVAGEDGVILRLEQAKADEDGPVAQPGAPISLYPNPVSSDFVTIEIDKTQAVYPIKCKVFNEIGSLTFTEELAQGNDKLSVADLPNGTYILRIESSTGRYLGSKKFVR